MKKFMVFIFIAMCLLLCSFPSFAMQAQGIRQPIVLVHGFLGFGEDEMLGYNYWGGFDSLKARLMDQGYTVHVAAVGPVSSSWDRACELYAQIKGGQVDYGRGHSAHFNHNRTDPLKTYPGFYPQWDRDHPIHLIGHSQGGQTIRLLARLLEQGHPGTGEVGYSADNEVSPLFQGGNRGWITSVTTLSTPHDGTTLAKGIEYLPFAQDFILGIASAIGVFSDDVIYDFKLGQWGLVKNPGESLRDYFQRVADSEAFNGTSDTSAWDMDPTAGVREFNGWVEAQPGIYYFSLSTEQTFKGFFTGYHLPELGMNPALHPATYFMGSYKKGDIDRSWFENDGVVNTVSMDGPKRNSSDVIENYDGTPQKGIWNHLGCQSLDHMDIIGVLPYPGETPEGYDKLYEWYRDLASMLITLE
ncbi:MAG: lipase [Desulfobacterales bacterium]|nr:lipase [Desulfobacterales bacterium]